MQYVMQAINAVFFSIFIWNGLIKVVNLGLIIPHKQINKISLMRPTNSVFAFFPRILAHCVI